LEKGDFHEGKIERPSLNLQQAACKATTVVEKSTPTPKTPKPKAKVVEKAVAKQTADPIQVGGTSNKSFSCMFCQQNGHSLAAYPMYSMVKARKDKLVATGRCVKCCRQHEAATGSTEIYLCRLCQGGHHTWLHISKTDKPTSKQTIDVVTLHTGAKSPLETTALPTAIVTIKHGKLHRKTRLFFYQGSQQTFITP